MSRRNARRVQVTLGVRGAAAGVAAAVAVVLWAVRRLSPEASVRRRILARLDVVAPRVPLDRARDLLNADCTLHTYEDSDATLCATHTARRSGVPLRIGRCP